MGYPGSRQSFWQRIGRSGRGTRDALSVFVPSHSTLDQYILQHPEYVLEEDHESAVVDLDNNPVYLQQLNCAAQELPLTRDDAEDFGGEERLERAVEYGRRKGDLEGSLDSGVMYAHRATARRTRSACTPPAETPSTSDYLAMDRLITNRSAVTGPTETTTKVQRFSTRASSTRSSNSERTSHSRTSRSKKANVSYYTQSQGQVNIYDTVVEDSREVGPFALNWGYGTVSVHYSTYLKREIGSGDVLELGNETGVPPLEMRTQLCWAETPNNIEQAMLNKHSEYHNPECINLPPRLHGYLGGIHAVEHAMIAVSPLELKVDGGDIGGLATNRLPGNPEKKWVGSSTTVSRAVSGSQGRFTNTSKTSPSVPTISSLIVRVAVTKGVPPVRWTTAAETTTAHCTLLQLRTSSSICSVIRRRMTSTNTSQRQIAK